MLDTKLAELNVKIGQLSFFDEQHGLDPMAQWLQKHAFPISQKYDVELGVNIYKDLYMLYIANVVTDKLHNKVYTPTLLQSRFGRLKRIAMTWHSHPREGSLGRSGFDLREKGIMKDKYPASFGAAKFWVTYHDSVKGILSREY